MSLEIIFGPMFAGKSSAILRIYNRYRSIQENILIVSHSIDARYDENHTIVNHDGSKIPCNKVAELTPVLEWPTFRNCNILIVEEAQFFPDLRSFVLEAVETYGKNVIVVGLDGDADRKPFGEILELIPFCDTITKLKAFCMECCNGTEALFTYCKKQKTEQVCVGGTDLYMPLCRRHYLAHTQNGSA